MTSFHLNYLLNSLTPNIVTLGDKASIYEFWENESQSMASHFLDTRPHYKHFTYIKSFDAHKDPVKLVLFYNHFIDGEQKAEKGYVTCPRSHNLQMIKPSLNTAVWRQIESVLLNTELNCPSGSQEDSSVLSAFSRGLLCLETQLPLLLQSM